MSDIGSSTKSDSIYSKQFALIEWLPIIAILIMVSLLYIPVITDAFNGDDFVHLKWLYDASKHPDLLWRNFHTPWLEITTAKFYRPLISLFMYADYVIWRGNGIGFHLTNLFCHLSNTLLFWLILRHVSITKTTQRLNHLWCLASAALFGFYPLHPEAVSWITGRVDTFVTLFSLGSIFCYMRWSDEAEEFCFALKQGLWFYMSLLTMTLALLCKEMAIILPAVFCLYELTLGRRSSLENGAPIKLYLRCFKRTVPFWLLLSLYFVLRYYALGTLVGGYDNSVFSFSDWHVFVINWARSLKILFFPFNTNIISSSNPFIFLWAAILAINFILVGKQVIVEKHNRESFLFCFGWLVLSLIPVYKVFNISSDLQGSRLVYLASLPLSALLCFGWAGYYQYRSRISYWRLLGFTLIVSAAGAGLLVNNSAWVQAETTSQAIVRQLNVARQNMAVNTTVYIVGLPDQINGAYVARNAIDGMSKFPQISKDIHYCFNLDEINHVFPFGFARQSMVNEKNTSSIQFLVWDEGKQSVKPFSVSHKDPFESWTADLSHNLHWQGSQVVVDVADQACFDISCLKVSLKDSALKLRQPVTLFYANELYPQFDAKHKICANLTKNEQQDLLFPLRSEADWAMGGKSISFKLVLPVKLMPRVKIEKISAEQIANVMPLLSFKANANQSELGFIELDKAHPTCTLEYDSTKVLNAQKVQLEITAPDHTFTVSNDTQQPAYPLKTLNGLKGLLLLNKSDFSGTGIYELRLRAFCDTDQTAGIAGDHIVVTVR